MILKWFLILSILKITLIQAELRFVFNIFRHGARGPSLHKDKLTDILGKTWQGDGELTGVGMRMHYLLGVRNRIKYGEFLSKSYDPKDIYVMSTGINRTIMSVLSQLNGLYPPETGPTIPKATEDIAVPPVTIGKLKDIQSDLHLDALKYRSQAIPVHSISRNSHEFNLHDNICPAIVPIRQGYLNKEAIKNHVKEFKAKWSGRLIKALGIKEAFFDSFEDIHTILDAFVCGYTEGLDYSFLEKAGINLKEFYDDAIEHFRIKYANIYDDKDNFIGHMSMSPFHLSLVEWMDTRVKYDKEGLGYVTYKTTKYVMLSGHDTNIGAIQAYFKKIFPDLFPGYEPINFAASLFYELHRKTEASTFEPKDYYVEVWYNNMLFFTIEYDKFRSNILEKSYRQSDVDKFCGFDIKDTEYIDYGLIIASSFLGTTSLVLLIIIVILCRKRKQQNETIGNGTFV
jgi:hypothetical protein